jgi:hypothetical protein
VNKSLKGKWAALACHETGSLVVQVHLLPLSPPIIYADYLRFQHAFENLEESAKDGIVDELLGQGGAVFGEVAKSQWGSYCIQHSASSFFTSLLSLLVLRFFRSSFSHRTLS